MRSSPIAVALADPPETEEPRVDAILRTLAGLIDALSGEREGIEPSGNAAEEVLIDTEVDGARYLLVRMRRPEYNRIQLSPREQEIVRMVAKGHPNKVIADVLNISSWTVCTHLRRIFAKRCAESQLRQPVDYRAHGESASRPYVQRAGE